MPKLTDTQLVILANAAQRDDRAVLPLPSSITLNKGAVTTVLKAMIKRGLIEERSTADSTLTWRQADNGDRLALWITAAGYEAVGIDPTDDEGAETRNTARGPSNPADGSTAVTQGNINAPVRPGTKLAQVIALLKRSQGATIADISAATGWQAHSVRGAISGTIRKKLGLTVTTTTGDQGRVYHIAGAP